MLSQNKLTTNLFISLYDQMMSIYSTSNYLKAPLVGSTSCRQARTPHCIPTHTRHHTDTAQYTKHTHNTTHKQYTTPHIRIHTNINTHTHTTHTTRTCYTHHTHTHTHAHTHAHTHTHDVLHTSICLS